LCAERCGSPTAAPTEASSLDRKARLLFAGALLNRSWLPFTFSSHINRLGEQVVASRLNALDDALQFGDAIC